MDDEYLEMVALGEDNLHVVELTRRHCGHARIEFVHGNSIVGDALGLPMGRLEVRCEHAPPPRSQSHHARELSIEFYEQNCTECQFRDSTGELPNLATAAAERGAELEAKVAVQDRLAADRTQRHRDRLEHRHRVLAGEGHVVRDLGDAIDRIDRAAPGSGASDPDEERAARNVLDTARQAPELFQPVLVDSLIELAEDVGDPTALQALDFLVRAGVCSPRGALDAALAVLARERSVHAGRLLALLEPELLPADLPEVLDNLIDMASGDHFFVVRVPSAPEGLIAASHVDLPVVIERIGSHLSDGDNRIRESGADAARIFLEQDPSRIVQLGPPLAASVRGPEQTYAGYPHPTTAALKALAEGWRGEPQLTRRIVEDAAEAADPRVKDELARVPWFLRQFNRRWDASTPEASEAVAFLVQRALGDWGEHAADRAADHLVNLASDIPEAIVSHTQALLGAVLALCEPVQFEPGVNEASEDGAFLAAMERMSWTVRREARRRHLAGALGRCAAADPATVLAPIHGLFSATSGDEDNDRAVRTTMLEALEEAVSPDTLRDVLPITYSALLDADQSVRTGGIDLWAACARVADSLPEEITALAQPLIEDTFVIVHRRMLTKIPYLRLPAHMAPTLLPVASHWLQVSATADPPNSDEVESAIDAIRSLAHLLEDETQRTAWYGVALMHIDRCNPYDRERLLSAWWPDELRVHPVWVRAALATVASPELADYYNQRHDPLLQMLLDCPRLLDGIPLDEIEPLSTVHGVPYSWRALEPVELLQAATRWADGVTIARHVETSQPPGDEGAPGRYLAAFVARSAELNEMLAGGPPAQDRLAELLEDVATARGDLEASFPDAIDGGQLKHLIDGIMASTTAARVLLDPIVADPTSMADDLDAAAGLLAGIPSAHCSGSQRQSLARSWEIASTLIRYDAAVRAAAPEAAMLMQSAKRQAQVLGAEIGTDDTSAAASELVTALAEIATIGDPATAHAMWRQLGCIPVPVALVGTDLLPQPITLEDERPQPEEPPRAVCVATMHGVPVTDTLVLRPDEVYQLGMTVRLIAAPEWVEACIVEPVSMLGREAIALPRFELPLNGGVEDEAGIALRGEAPLHCAVEQPIRGPALDCPIQVRLVGEGHDDRIEVAGFQRLRVRPFDPSRDTLTDHEQTDARLLKMFEAVDSPDFDTEDVRAFCRLFAACLRAAQTIMFEKTFRRGSRVSEGQFHDELERHLQADPELEGRLTRRDAVAGGFDDLLHDDVIAELKVSRGAPATIDKAFKYLGQPTQYGVGRGSQLSVLVVFDHGRKEAPPGVIDNYIGWLKPSLHGLDDPQYPSLVGVLIVNTNLPVPSAWSRRRIEGERLEPGTDEDAAAGSVADPPSDPTPA